MSLFQQHVFAGDPLIDEAPDERQCAVLDLPRVGFVLGDVLPDTVGWLTPVYGLSIEVDWGDEHPT